MQVASKMIAQKQASIKHKQRGMGISHTSLIIPKITYKKEVRFLTPLTHIIIYTRFSISYFLKGICILAPALTQIPG